MSPQQAAIYCRLSQEDREKPTAGIESRSIQNQRRLLLDYAAEQGWTVAGIYIDATDIIGLKQNPTYGRRFSPIFLIYRAFCGAKRKMLL